MNHIVVAGLAGVGRRRCYRYHAGSTENSGAIRSARRRSQDVCGWHFLHATARELRGRHADHFRVVHPDVSADDFFLAGAKRPVVLEGHGDVVQRADGLRFVDVSYNLRADDFVLLVFLGRHAVQRNSDRR